MQNHRTLDYCLVRQESFRNTGGPGERSNTERDVAVWVDNEGNLGDFISLKSLW